MALVRISRHDINSRRFYLGDPSQDDNGVVISIKTELGNIILQENLLAFGILYESDDILRDRYENILSYEVVFSIMPWILREMIKSLNDMVIVDDELINIQVNDFLNDAIIIDRLNPYVDIIKETHLYSKVYLIFSYRASAWRRASYVGILGG